MIRPLVAASSALLIVVCLACLAPSTSPTSRPTSRSTPPVTPSSLQEPAIDTGFELAASITGTSRRVLLARFSEWRTVSPSDRTDACVALVEAYRADEEATMKASLAIILNATLARESAREHASVLSAGEAGARVLQWRKDTPEPGVARPEIVTPVALPGPTVASEFELSTSITGTSRRVLLAQLAAWNTVSDADRYEACKALVTVYKGENSSLFLSLFAGRIKEKMEKECAHESAKSVSAGEAGVRIILAQ